jgi:hypothetical protein
MPCTRRPAAGHEQECMTVFTEGAGRHGRRAYCSPVGKARFWSWCQRGSVSIVVVRRTCVMGIERTGRTARRHGRWRRSHLSRMSLSYNFSKKRLRNIQPSAYKPPASSTFLSEQTSHQQSASSTFLSEQISTSHQPPAKRTGWSILHASVSSSPGDRFLTARACCTWAGPNDCIYFHSLSPRGEPETEYFFSFFFPIKTCSKYKSNLYV